jgi:Ni/Co efflux regulator RcnB
MTRFIVAGLMASVALSGVASAQSEREIRKDQRSVEAKREQLVDAQDRGNRKDIQEAREDLRGAREELREDRRDQRTSRYEPPYRNWSQSTPAMGTRLRPKFYGPRYVISDPQASRLGSVARNQRWIRYGDDLLLVNIRSGRVAQVLPRRYRDM